MPGYGPQMIDWNNGQFGFGPQLPPNMPPPPAALVQQQQRAPAGPSSPSMIQGQGMTADEFLARQGQRATGNSPADLAQAMLGRMGPELQMKGMQPASSFDGQTLTSRNVNQPAMASLLAGIRPQNDTLLYTETQQRMDPDAIAHRLAGQLAPTPEQRMAAMQFFNQFQQGQTGLMNAQEAARHNAADEALRRQVELSGGIPTALLQTQLQGQNNLDLGRLHNQGLLEQERLRAMNEDPKFIDALILQNAATGNNTSGDQLNAMLQQRNAGRQIMRQNVPGAAAPGPQAAPPAGSGETKTPEQVLRDSSAQLAGTPTVKDIDTMLKGTPGEGGKMVGGMIDANGNIDMDKFIATLTGQQKMMDNMPLVRSRLLNAGIAGGAPTLTKAVEEALLKRGATLGGGDFGPYSIGRAKAPGHYNLMGPGENAEFARNLPPPPLNPLAMFSGLAPVNRTKTEGEARALAQLLQSLQQQ